MLQQLALETSAQIWVVASMLFFMTVFAVVAVRIFRMPSTRHEAHARLPLQDDDEPNEASHHEHEEGR